MNEEFYTEIQFHPRLQSLEVNREGGRMPLRAGHRQRIVMYNIGSDYVVHADDLQLTIKRDNAPDTPPLVLESGGWQDFGDPVLGMVAKIVDFSTSDILGYLGDADVRNVEIEVRDMDLDLVIGYAKSVPMYRSIYRTGDTGP